MFIRNHGSNGVDVALAHIVSARHINGGFELRDMLGQEHRVSETDFDLALEATPVSMVPALPGTFLLERDRDDAGNEKVSRMTVLAWGTYADGATRPIVADPEALLNGSGKWFVEMPHGRVEGNCCEQWESAEVWLEKVVL